MSLTPHMHGLQGNMLSWTHGCTDGACHQISRNPKQGLSTQLRDTQRVSDATRSDNTRGKTAIVEEHALAGRIHRHVRNGNDGRAARCLDSSRMAVVDDITMKVNSRRSIHQRLPRFPPQWRRAPPARPRLTLTGSLASSSACRKAQHRASVAGRMSTSERRDCTARGQGTQ